MTAGTIFDRTRTPLTVWFTACWLFASDKGGISALSVQRALEIGSYQTAWTMLHRLRSVLVRPGRERLTGTVEVDETFIGGEEPGLRGGRARGKKVLTCIAVETREPKGLGRCRMAPVPDASAKSLEQAMARLTSTPPVKWIALCNEIRLPDHHLRDRCSRLKPSQSKRALGRGLKVLPCEVESQNCADPRSEQR